MGEPVEATKLVPKLSPVESATIPRLRFPRHSTQWQRIALKELLTEPPSYGLNAPATEYRANLPLYLRITDIDENGKYLRDGRVSVAQAVTSEAYLEQGDIAVARTGASVGKSYFCDGRDGPFVYAGFLIRLRANPNKLLPSLLAQWLRSDEYWRWVTLTSARSGQPGINGTEYASAAMPLPTGPLALEEQRKIAECLESLDELIAAETERMEALKRHKKGLLQQLFPAEGETTPRLRFPQFRDADEWSEATLGDVCTLISGQHLEPHQYGDSGTMPYFSGPSDITNDIRRVKKWVTESNNSGGLTDILVTVKGSGAGGVWTLQLGKAALGRQLMAVHATGCVPGFLYQYLLTRLHRLEAMAAGNLIPGLSRPNLLTLAVPLPSTEEQTTISDLLQTADEAGHFNTGRIEQLRAHKAALMQQLFPQLGETEL